MLTLMIYHCNEIEPSSSGIAIWGYSTPGCTCDLAMTSSNYSRWSPVAANAARDVGGRLAAMTIWGTKAAGGNYAALAALTNIPATLFAYIVYEVFFVDSSRGSYPRFFCALEILNP